MCIRKHFVLLLVLLACAGCSKEKSTDEMIGDLSFSTNERDRLSAVRRLPHHEQDAAKVVPALIKALKDRADHVRRSAAIGLGYFGEEAKDAIPDLQALLRDPDARTREAAAAALFRIDPDKFKDPRMTAKRVQVN